MNACNWPKARGLRSNSYVRTRRVQIGEIAILIHELYRPGDPPHDDFVQRFGSLDDRGYKDFIPSFRAEKFDPQSWVALFKQAGAKYVIPIDEHHDGFAMYDSDLSDWTVVKMGPHRDVLAELSPATRDAGLHFGLSSHRAEHNYYYGEDRSIRSDVNDPKYASFYGPAHQWLNDPHFNPVNEWTYVNDVWLRDWLARSVELVEKYKPELMYFDGGNGQPAYRASMTEFTGFYDNFAVSHRIAVLDLRADVTDNFRGQMGLDGSWRSIEHRIGGESSSHASSSTITLEP